MTNNSVCSIVNLNEHVKNTTGLVMATLLGISLVFSPPAASQQSSSVQRTNAACIELFNPAYKADDFRLLSQLFNSPPDKAICSESTIESIRGKATLKVLGYARQRLTEQGAADALEVLTGQGDASFRLASIWQVNELRGDIAMATFDWSEASSQFQTAYELSLGSNTAAMGKREAANAAVQQQLFLLANEAMQLAGEFGTAVTRSGESYGTFGTRGVKPRNVPLPVEFELDSAQLTSKSMEQVGTIVSFLQKRQYNKVELIGHTDWTGSENYNQDLSERRARSLAIAIKDANHKAGGAELAISIRGRGETCPRIISDRDRYNDQLLAKLYRRVEMRWPSAAGSRLKDCDENGKRE